mgnify:CR=1 FL=1
MVYMIIFINFNYKIYNFIIDSSFIINFSKIQKKLILYFNYFIYSNQSFNFDFKQKINYNVDIITIYLSFFIIFFIN